MWIIFTKYKRNATEILIQCFSPQFTELNEAHVLPSQSILVIPLALVVTCHYCSGIGVIAHWGAFCLVACDLSESARAWHVASPPVLSCLAVVVPFSALRTLNSSSKKNIFFWSSRFFPLYIFLPHLSSSISHTLYQPPTMRPTSL
jgi:hypothetical protein